MVVLAAHDAAVLALEGNTAPRNRAFPVVRSRSNDFAILDPVLFALLLFFLGLSWRLARALLFEWLLKLCTAAAALVLALHVVLKFSLAATLVVVRSRCSQTPPIDLGSRRRSRRSSCSPSWR